MGEPNKTFKTRSERMKSQDGEVNAFVRYSLPNQRESNSNAQFADISDSGMQIVARLPTSAQVGDEVEVEFTVPGTMESIVSSAQVVRKTNEFVFAVRFLGVSEKNQAMLSAAISQRFISARWNILIKPTNKIVNLFKANSQGLMISACALVFFGIVGSFIFLNSDEHKGLSLKTWTAPYPKQWDRDYVKHFRGTEEVKASDSEGRRR